MKKIILVLSMSLVLTACSSAASETSQKPDVNVNVNVNMDTTTKVESGKGGVVAHNNVLTNGASIKGTLSPMQSERLAKGMDNFGRNMGQYPYIKTDVPSSLTWQTGGEVAGYTIYESYIYQSGGTTHRYFFVTNPSGATEVLYSTGGTSVKHTENADIGGIFADAYGNSGAVSTPAPTASIQIGKLTSSQSEKLDTGMVNFGREMGQTPYVKTDVPLSLTWESGGAVSGYTVYESYIYQSGGTTHRYFFTTNPNGEAEVLYSTGGTSVKHTANNLISTMFWGILRG